MAKTKNQNSDLKDLQDSIPEKPKATAKTQLVRFKELIRADYGAFDEGDSAELPASLAKELMLAGIVDFIKETPAPAKAEEEFI